VLADVTRPNRVTGFMKIEPKPSDREVLAGLTERVTYHNAENGFCVLRAKVRGHRDVVTVVGHAAAIAAGEWITASGDWVNDRTHGQQFKARFLRTSPPTSADGKTTIVKAILRILSAKGVRLLLCAPTGRAAKRMTEATGFEAKTI